MLSRIDAHGAVGSPCDSVNGDRLNYDPCHTEWENKGGIIVCFSDNNNQSNNLIYLREQIRKILKNLAPKLAITPHRSYD